MANAVAKPWPRRQFLAAGAALLAVGAGSRQSRPLRLVTNWYAQAEHGGFYQALALGIYADYGLQVEIRMGGTAVNVLQLLAGGAADFVLGGSPEALAALQSGIPVLTVAAFFQKDPQCLLAHPGVGIERLEDLRGKPIWVSPGANLTYWPFLRAKFGFTDEQKRPYNFSLTPFLLDKSSAQQGYVTSEPFRVRQEGGFDPVVFLLADYGYSPYATTLETTRPFAERHPEEVRKFVAASIQGWQSYLEDPRPGNRLIRQDNPNMSEALLAYAHQALQDYNLLTGGDAATLGIGAMTHQRWQTYFQEMVALGIGAAGLEVRQAYTLDFLPGPTA
ncbi:ABC transporter substrate-binding protein [Synechococcus sp. 'PEA 65AY6A-5F PE A']|uniref:ABC transporter substrate-binding protein n=1 Tax=Synechococcus sp. 'PEA 65AY6A-5F PE A' TaxID=1504259 RepID=UPI0039C18FA3